LSFQTTGLVINKQLVQYALCQIPNDRLAGLQMEGRADVQVDLTYQPDATPALKPDVRCQLRQVCVDHPKLPVPLHNLSATLRCADGKLVLERLKAAAGTGKIECKAIADLADPENNYSAELTAYHLP